MSAELEQKLKRCRQWEAAAVESAKRYRADALLHTYAAAHADCLAAEFGESAAHAADELFASKRYSETSLLGFPAEIMHEIFGRLAISDLVNLAATCKRMYSVIDMTRDGLIEHAARMHEAVVDGWRGKVRVQRLFNTKTPDNKVYRAVYAKNVVIYNKGETGIVENHKLKIQYRAPKIISRSLNPRQRITRKLPKFCFDGKALTDEDAVLPVRKFFVRRNPKTGNKICMMTAPLVYTLKPGFVMREIVSLPPAYTEVRNFPFNFGIKSITKYADWYVGLAKDGYLHFFGSGLEYRGRVDAKISNAVAKYLLLNKDGLAVYDKNYRLTEWLLLSPC